MYKTLLTLVAALAVTAAVHAEPVDLDGVKADAPADWKSSPPTNSMRAYQAKLPAGSDLIVFVFPGGSGTVEQNITRQRNSFKDGKDDTKKVDIAGQESTYFDIQGTYLEKFPPFAPNAKITERPNYRELYVIYSGKMGKDYYLRLLGPAAAVEKDKEAFDTLLKNFK